MQVLSDTPKNLRARLRGAHVMRQCKQCFVSDPYNRQALSRLCVLNAGSCHEFRHYYRCHHSLLYTMKRTSGNEVDGGMGLVPRGLDVRPVGHITRGRPSNFPEEAKKAARRSLDHEADSKKDPKPKAKRPRI